MCFFWWIENKWLKIDRYGRCWLSLPPLWSRYQTLSLILKAYIMQHLLSRLNNKKNTEHEFLSDSLYNWSMSSSSKAVLPSNILVWLGRQNDSRLKKVFKHKKAQIVLLPFTIIHFSYEWRFFLYNNVKLLISFLMSSCF